MLGILAATRASDTTPPADFSDRLNDPYGDLIHSKGLPQNSLAAVGPHGLPRAQHGVGPADQVAFEESLARRIGESSPPQGAFVREPSVDLSAVSLLNPPRLFHSEQQAGEMVEFSLAGPGARYSLCRLPGSFNGSECMYRAFQAG
jgi:hypothetical protein